MRWNNFVYAWCLWPSIAFVKPRIKLSTLNWTDCDVSSSRSILFDWYFMHNKLFSIHLCDAGCMWWHWWGEGRPAEPPSAAPPLLLLTSQQNRAWGRSSIHPPSPTGQLTFSCVFLSVNFCINKANSLTPAQCIWKDGAREEEDPCKPCLDIWPHFKQFQTKI